MPDLGIPLQRAEQVVGQAWCCIAYNDMTTCLIVDACRPPLQTGLHRQVQDLLESPLRQPSAQSVPGSRGPASPPETTPPSLRINISCTQPHSTCPQRRASKEQLRSSRRTPAPCRSPLCGRDRQELYQLCSSLRSCSNTALPPPWHLLLQLLSRPLRPRPCLILRRLALCPHLESCSLSAWQVAAAKCGCQTRRWHAWHQPQLRHWRVCQPWQRPSWMQPHCCAASRSLRTGELPLSAGFEHLVFVLPAILTSTVVPLPPSPVRRSPSPVSLPQLSSMTVRQPPVTLRSHQQQAPAAPAHISAAESFTAVDSSRAFGRPAPQATAVTSTLPRTQQSQQQRATSGGSLSGSVDAITVASEPVSEPGSWTQHRQEQPPFAQGQLEAQLHCTGDGDPSPTRSQPPADLSQGGHAGAPSTPDSPAMPDLPSQAITPLYPSALVFQTGVDATSPQHVLQPKAGLVSSVPVAAQAEIAPNISAEPAETLSRQQKSAAAPVAGLSVPAGHATISNNRGKAGKTKPSEGRAAIKTDKAWDAWFD